MSIFNTIYRSGEGILSSERSKRESFELWLKILNMGGYEHSFAPYTELNPNYKIPEILTLEDIGSKNGKFFFGNHKNELGSHVKVLKYIND